MITMLRRCIFVKYLCGDFSSHNISLLYILSYVHNHQWLLQADTKAFLSVLSALPKLFEEGTRDVATTEKTLF